MCSALSDQSTCWIITLLPKSLSSLLVSIVTDVSSIIDRQRSLLYYIWYSVFRRTLKLVWPIYLLHLGSIFRALFFTAFAHCRVLKLCFWMVDEVVFAVVGEITETIAIKSLFSALKVIYVKLFRLIWNHRRKKVMNLQRLHLSWVLIIILVLVFHQ